MAERISLRQFQQELSRRLATAAAAKGENTAVLVVQSGGETWFLALADAGEVLHAPKLTPAPLTKGWYAGIANVRGNLYGVADFGAFRGAPPARLGPASRVLLCGQRHGLNAGLLVDQVLGLRDGRELKPVAGAAPAQAWRKSLRVDAKGGEFRELDVAALVNSAEFMNIAI